MKRSNLNRIGESQDPKAAQHATDKKSADEQHRQCRTEKLNEGESGSQDKGNDEREPPSVLVLGAC